LTTDENYVILYDMDKEWTLRGRGGRLLRLTYRLGRREAATSVAPVLTVREACRRLGKSRRQVYRYMRTGRLQPCAQVLGQWLFAQAAVEDLERRPIPSTLRRFFWDVRLADLSIDRHREFILGRLLEDGDRQALHWVCRTYPRRAVVDFLRDRGAALLSRRAWVFWSLAYGLDTRAGGRSSWRRRGRAWGGVR